MKAATVPLMPNRRQLADQAMKTAVNARLKAGQDLISPVCIYSLAEAHGVRVTFTDINMEGMYQRGHPPRIYLSSKRPLARRAFNCAHELGHHLLGHGSSIDELREQRATRPWDVPEEYGADTFGSYVLMPTLGLRNAFVARGLKAETASPADLYAIACQFGVGYNSLVTHLLWGEQMISRGRAEMLRRSSPQSIRAQILGRVMPQPLTVADRAFAAAFIDTEVGNLILTPSSAVAEGSAVQQLAELPPGRLFEATQPGLARLHVPGTNWAVFARVARHEYVGRSEFRHLEEVSDD